MVVPNSDVLGVCVMWRDLRARSNYMQRGVMAIQGHWICDQSLICHDREDRAAMRNEETMLRHYDTLYTHQSSSSMPCLSDCF